jgi:hypothetical protein
MKALRIAERPVMGPAPGKVSVAPTAKKEAVASASKVSRAPKHFFTRTARASDSFRIATVIAAVAARRISGK